MIPCANPLAQYQSHRDEIDHAIKAVLHRGYYVLGPEVEKFEHDFAAFCGVDYGIGVGSGTDALMLALRAFEIGPGDEVITVSHTAVATVAAIVACGATPVLVDVDPVYYTLDPECFRGAITNKTKAVIPVHLYGQCADMDAISAIAGGKGLTVIEDCAQATGAMYHGRRVGSLGDAACFSFYPTKNLGAIGDGGMIVTQSNSVAQRIRRLRQYGWNESRNTTEPGINSRLDEVQAAILNVKLKYLDVDNGTRRKIARLYGTGLEGCGIALPEQRPGTSHVYHLFVLASIRRDAIIRQLFESGIAAGIHYGKPCHSHGGYDRLCVVGENGLPVTERLAATILSLPMYPELLESEVATIVSAMSRIEATSRI